MSCYIVHDNHLSAIIRWACENNLKAGWQSPNYAYHPGQEQAAVDLLHAANVKSVNIRYSETHPDIGALYNANAPSLLPIDVIKACDGYAYQCDEWEGFEGSSAQGLAQDIQRAAIRKLPGYDKAKWEIT